MDVSNLPEKPDQRYAEFLQLLASSHSRLLGYLLSILGRWHDAEDVEVFLSEAANNRQRAFARLVDRLLDSPHFGERWGRHWLDVARYAESTGVNWNIPYPVAWRYRDYVISAFNADKPYDRFLHEQLAGDLLPASNDTQRNEQLIATGFLAIGLKDLQTLTLKAYQMDIVDEQIDTTSRAILGLSIACARCHDHKFDPIRTEEYYALAGIFASTEPLSGVMRGRKKDLLATRLQSLQGQPDTMTEKERDELIQATFDARRLSLSLRDTLQILDKAKEKLASMPNDADTAMEVARLEAEAAAIDARRETELARFEALNLQDHASLNGKAMAVRDATPADCPVFVRGEPDRPGPTVPRGVPAVLTRSSDVPLVIGDGESGRLALAKWLTSSSAPLTARVMVNRVWLHLIGAGIVESVDDFGTTGQKPSHPELLDYLARRFIESGWSVKQLIREIMSSRVYQLASAHNDQAHAVDPANRLLWRANRVRLDSEVLRDSLLYVSGSLTMAPPCGSPVQGTANEVEFYQVKGLFNPVVLNRDHLRKLGEPANTTRMEGKAKSPSHARGLLTRDYRFRSVYLPSIRGGTTEVRAYFDGAAPEEVVGHRAITTVPTQALFLMSSPFVVECSKLLAEHVYGAMVDDASRLRFAFQCALGRPPTPVEERQSQAYLAEYADLTNKTDTMTADQLAWATLCQTLLATGEFRYRY